MSRLHDDNDDVERDNYADILSLQDLLDDKLDDYSFDLISKSDLTSIRELRDFVRMSDGTWEIDDDVLSKAGELYKNVIESEEWLEWFNTDDSMIVQEVISGGRGRCTIEVSQLPLNVHRPKTAKNVFAYHLQLLERGSRDKLPLSSQSLSRVQIFTISLMIYIYMLTRNIDVRSASIPRVDFMLHSPDSNLYMTEVQWEHDAEYRKLLTDLLLSKDVLVKWDDEPFVPWKGMRLFHGSDYRRMQERPSGRDYADNDAQNGQLQLLNMDGHFSFVGDVSWSNSVRRSNNAAEYFLKYAMKDCGLRPDTSFTTPYVEKAINYSQDKCVYTYTLKKDGQVLRMLDLRSDYDIPSKRGSRDRFKAIEYYTGIKYGNDVTKNRVGLALLLYKLFKDTDVDGAILNNDIEWIWFKPQENLAWEWNPEYDSFTNRLANIGYVGSPAEPEIISAIDREWHLFGHYGSRLDQIQHQIKLISAPRTQLEKKDWSETVFNSKMQNYLKLKNSQVKTVYVSSLRYSKWTIASKKPGVEYTNQYWNDSGMLSESVKPWWGEERIDASSLRVVVVDYIDFWQAVCPDAINIYMGNAVTEDTHSRKDIPSAYDIILSILRKQRLNRGEKPIQLLFKLPNGRHQLVPPIDKQTKALIDELTAEETKKRKAQRIVDDSHEPDASKRRTFAPDGRRGTQGRVMRFV